MNSNIWKISFTELVNVVKFVTTYGLAFRGSEEKIVSQTDWKFFRKTECTSYYDTSLADHLEKYGDLGSGETSYASKVIYEELIHLKQVFSFIVKEMKDRKYFSISVDSTPGVSNTCQLTVIAHSLLCPWSRIQLTIRELQSKNSTPAYKGIQTRIKKHRKYADYCPCAAHLLNLVGE